VHEKSRSEAEPVTAWPHEAEKHSLISSQFFASWGGAQKNNIRLQNSAQNYLLRLCFIEEPVARNYNNSLL